MQIGIQMHTCMHNYYSIFCVCVCVLQDNSRRNIIYKYSSNYILTHGIHTGSLDQMRQCSIEYLLLHRIQWAVDILSTTATNDTLQCIDHVIKTASSVCQSSVHSKKNNYGMKHSSSNIIVSKHLTPCWWHVSIYSEVNQIKIWLVPVYCTQHFCACLLYTALYSVSCK